MDREALQAALLAKDPYLWVDEVVSIDDDQIHARKYLDPELELFKAHYTDFPLFPGALQCEAAFQASAVLIARTQPTEEGKLPVIARVRNVKFRRMVRPGETIDIVVKRRDIFRQAITCHGRISVNGETTTELTFVATEAALDSQPAAVTAAQ